MQRTQLLQVYQLFSAEKYPKGHANVSKTTFCFFGESHCAKKLKWRRMLVKRITPAKNHKRTKNRIVQTEAMFEKSHNPENF